MTVSAAPPFQLRAGMAQTANLSLFFFYYIFLKSKFVLKRSYLDFYLFSVAAGRKCSAESRASACVWRPSSNGVTRGTRRYAYLSSVSKKFFVALRGIRTLIAFSTFAFALPFYYPLISSRLIFRLCCPKGIVGMWICPFIYCTDANYIFTLCLKQWQKKKRTHTHTYRILSEIHSIFFFFIQRGFVYITCFLSGCLCQWVH